MPKKSDVEPVTEPSPDDRPRKGRHFLRAALVPKSVIQVGEPVRVHATLRPGAPEDVTVRIGGATGAGRYVSFGSPGLHKVPVIVAHPDGRQDRTDLEFEVVGEPTCAQPYPILTVRQEPTNPFLLHVSLQNVEAVHRPGVTYEWEIPGHGAFTLERPFFVLDCEQLLNPHELLIPFDLSFTALYPDGERRTAKESFRVFNDYAWFKSRGVLKPRLSYDHRARGAGTKMAASCVMVNDDDEEITLFGRQIEILHDDPDHLSPPGRVERLDNVLAPRSQRDLDCSVQRRKLPPDALGYAVHFHGTTRSGLKVEASAYFEHYAYQTRRWADVTSLDAIDLLNEVKAALAESVARPRTSTLVVRPGGHELALAAPNAHSKGKSSATPAVPPALAPLPTATSRGLTFASVRNYVDGMRATWTPAESTRYEKGLASLFGTGQSVLEQDLDEAFFLGKQCLLDEDPPTSDLFCRGTGTRGEVFVPARVINGKKGDVVLLPGGPIGFIGKLLLALAPPQFYSHCGIMTGNFYKLRHATASDDWIEDQVIGSTFVAPDDRGTQGFDPEALKYIWPGTVDQTVDEAFHGSYFQYESKGGKRKKMYQIKAFSNDPVFFMERDRHVVFPMVLKPDPLLEGAEDFAHVRPTLHKVAESAKRIKGHYRFFCYSNGAISLRDDVAHLAPDQGPSWWASGTRPMVCSSLVLAAIDDVDDVTIRMEGAGTFTSDRDLEHDPSNPPGAKGADEHARVDALTRDGMYLYTAEERLLAAEALYEKAYDKALGKAGDLGRLLTDAPDDVANQICNTFAFDYSGREFDDEDAKDSEKWRQPGVGRAVSPDDMLTFWDPPTASKDPVHGLYGSAQRMVFRDGFLEERDLGVWVIREKMGKLKVSVVRNGRPIPGSDVKVGGQVLVTDPAGKLTVELPEGSYTVEAGALLDGRFCEGRAPAKVADRGESSVVVTLNDPPDFKRIVMFGGTVRIKDLEGAFEKDEILHDSFSLPPVRLNPLDRRKSAPYVRKWGGEIRVEATFDLTWNADLSVTVVARVKLFEGASESTEDLDGEGGGVVTVARDALDVPLDIFVRNDDEDDDDHVALGVLISNVFDV